MRKSACLSLLVLTLSTALSLCAFAQVRHITGTVLDENKSFLQGATVSIKNTKAVTTTNQNGRFALDVPSGGSVLVISYVSMKPQEIPIDTREDYVVNLVTQGTTLNDVVVVGYGTRRRAEITSAISSISTKDLKDMPVAGIDQAIQGKVAGVTVSNNTGQPGGGVSVRVRGITSVNGSEPLYVVDGVLFEAPSTSSMAYSGLGGSGGQTTNSFLATINPSDIESIDILKDASAQAIYGSRAANGVVIINTKKGRQGEGKINYEMYTGWQQVHRKVDIMNLQQFAYYQNQIADETGNTKSAEFADPNILGEGTDWQDAIFQTGNIQNHQLSFSGGQNKTNYYFSANYFNQQGIIIGSKFNRYSIRFNLDQQVKSWFRAGISANGSRTNQKLTLADEHDGTVTQAVTQSPLIPINNLDGSWGGPSTIGGMTYYQDNPVAKSNLRDVTSLNTSVFGRIYGEFLIAKYVTFHNSFGYNIGLNENTAFQHDGQIGTTVYRSQLNENRGNSFSWYLQNYANFNKTFGARHNVSATAGHEASSWRWDGMSGSRYNLQAGLGALAAGSQDQQTLNGNKSEGAMESWFGRAGYMFDNRYSVNLSFRADNASYFTQKNKWGYFPAASVGWTVTNESFARDMKFLNYLKIRAGYGSVGNSRGPAGAPSPPYVGIVRFLTNGFGQGNILANIENPDLKWETVTTQNIGADFTVLNRRIDFTIDIYKKITTDMLLFSFVPRFAGVGTNWDDIKAPVVNAGKMTNSGVDLSLTSHNVMKKDFTWNTTVIFSHYKNVLNSMINESSSIDRTIMYGTTLVTHTVPGQPVGSFYGLVTNGIFRTQADLTNSLPQFGLGVSSAGTWLGDVRFADVNGDKVIDEKDLTFIGNPNPKFTYSMTNTFAYKGFDLSLYVYGSQGAKILNIMRRGMESLDNLYLNQKTSVLDRYTASNTDGALPRFTFSNKNNNAISDRWIEDGSYLRIQNLTVGYTLPRNILQKAKISNVRVYFSGQNLFTFTKYSGYDPEIGSYNSDVTLMNVDNGHYPTPRSFTIGANVEF